MQTSNPFNLLKKLEPKPQSIPVNQIKGRLSKDDIQVLTHLGLTISELSKKVELETTINYDRSRFYNEVTRAIEHWFVGPAMGLYSDYATAFNTLHNASVWITSKSPKYQKELSKLLERIGIEEKILDWAWTTGGYGDLFIEVKGQPGIGVYAINDDEHPLNISRIDHEGCLIGFYRTPQGQTNSNPQAIIPPWEWVHCLAGDTKIHLLDGTTPTIQEMSENSHKYIGRYCLSVNPVTLKLEPDKIVAARKTRTDAQLVRVHLDNELFVDCTPNHQFLLRNGLYKEAQYLQQGDSLMPQYTRTSGGWLKG